MSWIHESVFYHIYPLGFCGAPQQNDFQVVPRIEKLAEWITHLTALHVNVIYLGPVCQSTEHGYDTIDYYQIDDRLGSNDDFKKVCDALHAAGIRIILDGVFNHVGRDFWAFYDVQKKLQNSKYCAWFHNLNFGGASPCGDPFWYEGWQGHYNLVKLNLKNPEVVAHLLGAVELWMHEFGIDGLRLDAADCVDPDFFRSLRSFCKQRDPDFWLVGEIIHGDYNHWANPTMLDSVTNYECQKGLYSSHNDKNYFEIGYSLNRQFGNGGIYKNLCLYNFVDNHDVNRLASMLKDQKHLNDVYTLLYTMPGVPSIYYGSEWGLSGARTQDSDAPLRPCLELGEIPHANEELCTHIARLGRLRGMLHALRYGGYEQVLLRNEQIVFCRMHEQQRVYIAINCASDALYIEFRAPAGQLVDLLANVVFESNDGNYKLELPAYGARILMAPDDCAKSILDATQNPVLYMKSVKDQKEAETKLCVQSELQPAAPVPQQPVQQDPAPAKQEKRAEPQSVPLGIYRHFKGNHYAVVGMCRHSETLEELVLYRALHGAGALWVRPVAMFTEMVEYEGRQVARFEQIGDGED